MTERLKIEVDDAELDAAIAKLKQALSLSQTTLGTPNINKGMKTVAKSTGQLQFTLRPVTSQMELLRYKMGTLGVDDMPGLNREMRIILGQIPGMREAMRLYFNVKRLGRGVAGADMQLTLSLLATGLLLLKFVLDQQRRIEQKQRNYESFIRRERGVSSKQWKTEKDYWMSYLRSSPP